MSSLYFFGARPRVDAFCRIASKAKSLTAQPKANPFTDTDDKAVLALHEAGVIDGMTATTFEPEGLLTRAQIAKIILRLTPRGAESGRET